MLPMRVPALLLLALMTGCLGSSDDGGTSTAAKVRAAADNLQDCGLYGEGTVGSVRDTPLDWLDGCALSCLARASCDDLAQLVCNYETTGDLEACQTACALEGSFTCPSGAVVAATAVCDGVDNCVGGEDEADCPEPTSECALDPYWVCDGEEDCEDGTDEADCDYAYCDGDNIVPRVYFCDGWEWCEDGTDEEGCAERQCDDF